MLNLFQPLPCRAIFSRDPCPLALGSKRALLPSLPALLHRSGRDVSFSLFLFFSMPRSKCRWWDHLSYVRKRESPSCRGRHHASALRSPRSHAREDPKIGTRGSISLTRPAFTRKAGDFREVDELVTWKASYGKKQGIFSCRKLSIRRWLLTLFCRLR